MIVQKFYTHFKKAPGTHKLGVLYLIDSVVRKWVEQAKHNSQEISSSAQDGTFAAGVFRVTEIVPALMDNIVQTAPVDQKVCLKNVCFEQRPAKPRSHPYRGCVDHVFTPGSSASPARGTHLALPACREGPGLLSESILPSPMKTSHSAWAVPHHGRDGHVD